jgi:ubiquinone/menaquinone biosynthesis C-methylase UbiE
LRTVGSVSNGAGFEVTVPEEAVYLDRVAATVAGRSYKLMMLDLLELRPGETVIDLGCGPGTDLAMLGEAVTPSGRAIGVDSNPEMVERAAERSAALSWVEVQRADMHDLPLRDGAVDRVRVDRALQHVRNPDQVLGEARRVLRAGGRLVVAEPDWDSLVIDYPDLGLARAYTRHVTERVVRNGVIGRQIPRLARAAGFSVSTVLPVTTVFGDLQAADQILGIERNTRRAVTAGYFPADAAQRWLDDLARDPFVAAVTLYISVADLG